MITPNPNANFTLVRALHLNPDPICIETNNSCEEYAVSLRSLFSSTSSKVSDDTDPNDLDFCLITTYALTDHNGVLDPIPDAITAAHVRVARNATHDHLVLSNVIEKIISFSLMAETTSGVRGWVDFTVNFRTCASQIVSAVQPVIKVEIRKNQAQDALVITRADYVSNFVVDIEGCPHGLYHADLMQASAGVAPFPTNSSSPYPCMDDHYEDGIFVPASCQDIYINTQLPPGVNEFNTSFVITAETKPPNVNTASFTVEVSIGCYDLLSVSAEISGQHQTAVGSDQFKIAVPAYDRADRSTLNQTMTLGDLGFVFPTDEVDCNASHVDLYGDPAHTQPHTSECACVDFGGKDLCAPFSF